MHSHLGRALVIHSFIAVNDVFTCGLGEAKTMPAGLMYAKIFSSSYTTSYGAFEALARSEALPPKSKSLTLLRAASDCQVTVWPAFN